MVDLWFAHFVKKISRRQEKFFEMSKAMRRKHVMLEGLYDDFSHPSENQQIVRVLVSRGNNLHEVESTSGTTFLISMPTKYRKNVWVKRGDFVLVEPIEEGDKVKAEIVRILTPQHVKQFKKERVWPKEFDTQTEKENSEDDLFVNTNRPLAEDELSDESDTTESSKESSDKEDEQNSDNENSKEKKPNILP